jgi:iron(III) transport system substrate-binding protein
MRKGLIAVTLLALVGVAARADEYDLQIITPHNENIQAEFERAFTAHVGRPLKIRWIKKGTGEILKQLDAQEKAEKGQSFGLDVFFGGGVPDHDEAAAKGYLERATLPEELIKAIPPRIAGVSNFGQDQLWIASAQSAFGILSNTRGLAAQNLPEIKSWADLGDPRMYSWVVIADPRKSASVRVSYELILQHYGWDKGWPLLMQIAANSRTIADTSGSVPNEVATGNVLAGPCIDFYAAGRLAKGGADALQFVIPAGESAITPDPIALLRKAPNRALAEQFIAFVLSPAGQKLWVAKPGAPGGPATNALFRMPVRPDVCAEFADEMVVKDPYAEARAGKFFTVNDKLQRARNDLLSELMGAALVDLHAEVRAAWKALIDSGMKPAALAEWNKLPFSEAESLELAKKLGGNEREARQITREWTKQFRDKYQRVKDLAK